MIPIAAGIATGAAFSALNLWLLSRLAAELLKPAPRRKRIVGLLALKFAGIYPVMIGVLAFRAVSLAGFAIGFTTVLAAAAVKAAASSTFLSRNVPPAGGASSRVEARHV